MINYTNIDVMRIRRMLNTLFERGKDDAYFTIKGDDCRLLHNYITELEDSLDACIVDGD